MSLRKLFNTKYIAQKRKVGPPPDYPVTDNFEFEKGNQIHSQPKKAYPKEIPFYASFKRILKSKFYKDFTSEKLELSSLKKGSLTIEAAVVMPLFITLMVFGLFIFRLLQVQSGVQQSIDNASRYMAVSLGEVANLGESNKDVDPDSKDPTIKGELSEAMLHAVTLGVCAGEIVKNNVPLLYVDGGTAGFNFMETSVEGNYIDVRVNYQMTFPVGLLGKYSYDVSQRARCRKWVGYDKAEDTVDSAYVFITEKGEVYHTNYHCTYLNPSVRRIHSSDLKSERNVGGEKYAPCKRCSRGKSPESFIFVTDYGTSWHSDVTCTEIKHNIKKVPLEEVKDKMRPCSKCSAGEKH